MNEDPAREIASASQPSPSQTVQPIAVDLFAGAGGFSLGLRRAGFRVVLANEFSVDAEMTYRANLLNDELTESIERLRTADGASVQAIRGELRKTLMDLRDTYDSNSVMQGGDIAKVLPDERLTRWKDSINQEIDLIVAGPPCQGFSSAGRRTEEDERNHLVKEALRVIRVLTPKFVVIENVPGMVERHEDIVNSVISTLQTPSDTNKPYVVAHGLLSCLNFGVPQTRRRLIIVGVRADIAQSFQEFTVRQMLLPTGCPLQRAAHGSSPVVYASKSQSSYPVATVLQGLSEDPPTFVRTKWSSAGYSSQITEDPFVQEVRCSREAYLDGRNANSHDASTVNTEYSNHEASSHASEVSKRMQLLREAARQQPDNRCKSSILRKIVLCKCPDYQFTKKVAQRVLLSDHWPALTVTSLPDDVIHYSRDRIPTVRELARLQSFPDWFTFYGVRTTGAERRRKGEFIPQYTQVANGVPPRLAFAIGSHIQDLLSLLQP